MGWFTSPKRVTERELMREIKPELKKKGFSGQDIKNVEERVSGHMGEQGIHKGMDKKEAEQLLKDFKKHPSSLSSKQQTQLKESLEKRL